MPIIRIILTFTALLFLALLTASSQTQAAPPSQPSPSLRPIVDLKTGCLLGATQNGRWLTDVAARPQMRGGERYRLYNLTKYLGMGTGTRPASEGPPCEDTQFVTVTPATLSANATIGLGGTWNAQPRLPRAAAVNQQVYIDATAALLRQNGITNPRVRIKEIFRVDLDGDRNDEVLITATNYATTPVSPSARVGDYSVVYMRKLVRGRVETQVIAGDFYTRAVPFGAPSEYKVSAVLDANGDGILEVFIYGQYYEGHWTSVFRLVNNRLQEVLSCGCGA